MNSILRYPARGQAPEISASRVKITEVESDQPIVVVNYPTSRDEFRFEGWSVLCLLKKCLNIHEHPSKRPALESRGLSAWKGKMILKNNLREEKKMQKKLTILILAIVGLLFATAPTFSSTEAPTKKSWSERANEAIFQKKNAYILATGLAFTGLIATQDDNIRNFFNKGDRLGCPGVGNQIGKYAPLTTVAALYISGKVLKNEKLITTSIAGIEAMLITGGLTHLLKFSCGRARPGDKGRGDSFPSGHTSDVFSVATVVAAMYDWDLKIAIPAYTLATFVGLSRLDDDAHWGSDISAGATLGILVGIVVTDYHKKKSEEQKFFVLLIASNNKKGLMLTWNF